LGQAHCGRILSLHVILTMLLVRITVLREKWNVRSIWEPVCFARQSPSVASLAFGEASSGYAGRRAVARIGLQSAG
jgi:hypothetical protein